MRSLADKLEEVRVLVRTQQEHKERVICVLIQPNPNPCYVDLRLSDWLKEAARRVVRVKEGGLQCFLTTDGESRTC